MVDLFRVGHRVADTLDETPIQIWMPFMALRGAWAFGFEAEGVRHHRSVSMQASKPVKFGDTNPWAEIVPGALPEDEMAEKDADGGFARALLGMTDAC